MILLIWLALLALVNNTFAFLFSQGPKYYEMGQKVDLVVNKVESDNTQLPYGFYDLSFVCPSRLSKPLGLLLGQILRGDRLWELEFDLKFGVAMDCMGLCIMLSRDYGIVDADKLVREGYVVHWLIDGLPGATTFVLENNNNKYYHAGFPLGFVEDDVAYLYNHYMIVIRWHREKNGKNTIVGFEVYPRSLIDTKCPGARKDYQNFPLTPPKTLAANVKDQKKTSIPYTYSVYWREDNSVDWSSRWLMYYESETSSHHIRWISVINLGLLLLLLLLVVAVLLMRLFDLEKLNQIPFQGEIFAAKLPSSLPVSHDNSGWRAHVGDVFSEPPFADTLAVFVSLGLQLLIVMCGVIVVFTINTYNGIFFDNHHGALYLLSLLFSVFSGVIPLYFGIVLHKIFHTVNLRTEYPIRKVALLLAVFTGFLPTVVLLVVIFINIFVKAKASTYALPIETIIQLLLLCFFFLLPLGVIGGYYGNSQNNLFARWMARDSNYLLYGYSSPTLSQSTTQIPKPTPFLLTFVPSTLIFGLVPFGIVYVELLYIFNSVWLEKTTFYSMHGFLFVTMLSLIVVIAEATILTLYVSLAVYHNLDWKWLCFRVGSLMAWYVFGYLTYYFARVLYVRDFVSVLLYFTYMGLVSGLIGLACGLIGVITGWVLINRLFGSVKKD